MRACCRANEGHKVLQRGVLNIFENGKWREVDVKNNKKSEGEKHEWITSNRKSFRGCEV